MENHLPSMLPRVDDQAVASLINALLLDNLASEAKQVTHQRLILGGQIVDRGNVFIGDNQDVGGRHRVDIAEGGGLLVRVDDLSWRLASNNATKDAISQKSLHVFRQKT